MTPSSQMMEPPGIPGRFTTTDQTITFTYDAGINGKGHLTGASDANHSMSWGYDGQGRVISKGQTVGTVTKSVTYGYTNADLTSMTTPSGQTITYGFNSNHQVTSVTLNGSTTILNNVGYEPLGPVNGWSWGNGTTTTRTYDTDGKIGQIVSAGTKTLTYDDAFRITGIADTSTGAANWTYGYDLSDRLTSGTSSAITRGWTYDANGNRKTETGSAASTYTVSATSNRINSISGALARTYGYDAAGNTLTYATVTATYNNRGRAQTVKKGSVTETLVYNALGQMIKTSGGASGTVLYWYDEAGHLLGEYSSTGTLIEETIWLGDIPVATLRPNGASVSVYYIHSDQLNTPRQVSRPSDNKIMWNWFSDPFGTTAANTNPAGAGAFAYNLRFPGQVFDGQAGLHQNYFRDFDPAVGRYVEPDPAGQLFYFSLSNLPAARRVLPPSAKRGYWNQLFVYGDDGPAMHRDPYGLGLWDWVLEQLGEKAQDTAQEAVITSILSSGCLAENCKRKAVHRSVTQAYGDCASLLDRITKQQGAAIPGGMQASGDVNALLSECAEQCSKAIEEGACPGCKGGS